MVAEKISEREGVKKIINVEWWKIAERNSEEEKRKRKKFTKKAPQTRIKYVLHNYYVESAKSV